MTIYHHGTLQISMYPEQKCKQLEDWKTSFTNRCNYVKKRQKELYNVDSPRGWKGFRNWVKRVFPLFGNICGCNIVTYYCVRQTTQGELFSRTTNRLFVKAKCIRD